jgi:hypothetical protein
MVGYYHNLIEDEKDAANERRWIRIALGVIFFGVVYWWMKKPRKE